jgi:hypothetical protein
MHPIIPITPVLRHNTSQPEEGKQEERRRGRLFNITPNPHSQQAYIKRLSCRLNHLTVEDSTITQRVGKIPCFLHITLLHIDHEHSQNVPIRGDTLYFPAFDIVHLRTVRTENRFG